MNVKLTKHFLENLPIDQSILLRARHGCGKSNVVSQVADKLGVNFYDVRLSQCEVGDIKGYPDVDREKRVTEFLKSKWWPRDPESKGILFFDELNRAAIDVQQAVFEICLDRRLDGEMLPDGWRVVAAINDDEDYQVSDLDPALLDRWFVIDFDPDFDDWQVWAAEEGIHSAIIKFLSNNSESLDPPTKGNLAPGKVYPSRRSWEKLHYAMKSLNLWESKDDGLITMLTKGWVGSSVANAFTSYFLSDYKELKSEDILDRFNEVKDDVEAACAEIAVISSISNSLLREMEKRDKLTEANLKNLRNYLITVPKEATSHIWVSMLRMKQLKQAFLSWKVNDEEFANYMRNVYVSDED
jgi:hypothetical protein